MDMSFRSVMGSVVIVGVFCLNLELLSYGLLCFFVVFQTYLRGFHQFVFV